MLALQLGLDTDGNTRSACARVTECSLLPGELRQRCQLHFVVVHGCHLGRVRHRSKQGTRVD